MALAAIMPAKTGVPTACRLSSAAPCATTKRIGAEDEGERRHHHRAKSHSRAEYGGLADVHALLAPVLSEFDDQNAVFGGHRDQHDEPNLGIKVDGQAKNQNSEKRPQHADRLRQQYRDRDHPAFVEANEEQKRE